MIITVIHPNHHQFRQRCKNNVILEIGNLMLRIALLMRHRKYGYDTNNFCVNRVKKRMERNLHANTQVFCIFFDGGGLCWIFFWSLKSNLLSLNVQNEFFHDLFVIINFPEHELHGFLFSDLKQWPMSPAPVLPRLATVCVFSSEMKHGLFDNIPENCMLPRNVQFYTLLNSWHGRHFHPFLFAFVKCNGIPSLFHLSPVGLPNGLCKQERWQAFLMAPGLFPLLIVLKFISSLISKLSGWFNIAMKKGIADPCSFPGKVICYFRKSTPYCGIVTDVSVISKVRIRISSVVENLMFRPEHVKQKSLQKKKKDFFPGAIWMSFSRGVSFLLVQRTLRFSIRTVACRGKTGWIRFRKKVSFMCCWWLKFVLGI